VPIFGQGYRRWEGQLSGRFFRWWVIAKTGVNLTGQSKWLKRFVVLAWLPLLYYVALFFAVGQITEITPAEANSSILYGLFSFRFGNELADAFVQDPAKFRLPIWSVLIHVLMRYIQVFSVMIVVAIVGPRLVSEDLRTRALSLYFSKPLTRLDYVVGKLGVVAFWVGSVTLAPALVLYGLSIAFSPNLATIGQTIAVVPSIFAFSLLLMVGCGAPMLALSSMAKNPRFLGFIWAGAWALSSITSIVIEETLFRTEYRYDEQTQNFTSEKPEGDWSGLVSISTNFNTVSYALFDIQDRTRESTDLSPEMAGYVDELKYEHSAALSALLILVTAAGSLVIVTWRIGRPGEQGA
jgi:ABC-2 type transport system permease protein